MTAWAIVAVPSKSDPVWKYSSEKVPHMTLLYFGEQTDGVLAAKISEFVEHAATTLHPFGLSVDERGVLGDEKADVLFFNDLFAKQITQFRDNLLKNDEIFTLWNSVEQYPTWTPHLTMGYPETPAKPIPDGEFQPSWVNFDRIEFWVNDFDGPSFRLADAQDTALAHYGVKGMRWGVRRSREELGYADGADSSSSGSSSKSGTSSSSGTSTDAEDADALSIKAYKNGIESLSNQELQTLTMRNNAERQYLESIANYQRTLSPPTNPNQKLSDKVARMNLEKQYKTLQKELNPPKPKPVRTFAKKVAGDVLKEQATTLISATVAKKFAIELDRRGATTQALSLIHI